VATHGRQALANGGGTGIGGGGADDGRALRGQCIGDRGTDTPAGAGDSAISP